MKNVVKRIITGAVLGLLFWGAFMIAPPLIFSCILLGILLQIIFFEWQRFFNLTEPTFWLLMPVYPILPFILLIMMNHHPEYRELLFILFVIVFSHDTGSYVVGTLVGKHKICPSISPGKTWEGFFGGYIAALIGLRILFFEQGINKPWWLILFFTLFICLLSLAGDLFESWLKRRASIKDSGTMLPGHGGFLDRFDGLMFAAVFFFCFKHYLVKIF